MKIASAPEPARGGGSGKVTVRLDAASLKCIDALVATGAFPDRPSATKSLINKGFRANALLFDRIRAGLAAIAKEEEHIAIEEEQLRRLHGEAATSMISGRKSARAELRKAVDRHIVVCRHVVCASERLHEQRTHAVEVVKRAEEYMNCLAHSPKEFKKNVERCRVEDDLFEGDLKRFQQDYERATRVGKAFGGAGAVAGVGIVSLGPTAALAVATTFGTASTGTAISALSGAAATNAALAWLGGGALAAGGGGMAAGTALVAFAGPVGWTVALAAIAFSWKILRKKREEANELRSKVETRIRSLAVAERYIDWLTTASEVVANGCSDGLDRLARQAPDDYRHFDVRQKERLAALNNHVRTLSVLIRRPLGGDAPSSHQPSDTTPSPRHPGRQEAALEKADASRSGPHVAAQTAAAWTAEEMDARSDALDVALTRQNHAFEHALDEMRAVEDFVGAPEHILGSASTKHGEIAEQVTVAVRRAFDVLHQRMPTATFEGVGRLAPEDYVDGGVVQSKYHQTLSDSLEAVASHVERYEWFVPAGGRYHIPRDQFEQLEQLRKVGKIDGLSELRVQNMERQVESLEQHAGRALDRVIAPGEATYDEVQYGQVHETIQDQGNRLTEDHEALQDTARAAHGLSLDGALGGAGSGAAAGSGVRFAQAVWSRMRAGRNPFRGEFSPEDWKEVGLDTTRGATFGTAAGGALYLLSNATGLAAPFAGSFVSSVMGIGTLVGEFQTGKIDAPQFVDLSLSVASEAAIVGLSAAVGQIAIPAPMLGAFVGSVAGKVVAAALRGGLGRDDTELAARIDASQTETIATLDSSLRDTLERIDVDIGRFDALARLAFDQTVNTKLTLETSARMALELGVASEEILRSKRDVDRDMLT